MAPAPAADAMGTTSGPGAPDAAVLVVNAGSSSLKYGLYGPGDEALAVGQVEGLDPSAGEPGTPRFEAALARLEAETTGALQAGGRRLVAVAHRIVHGGARYRRSQPLGLDDRLALRALCDLAPLHQPHNLDGVNACAARWPDLPQIGCFDTAFHAGLPEEETRLPLPDGEDLEDLQGVRRYGFHGLSYQHLVDRLRPVEPALAGRALLCHLGSGASLCATRDGRSVATTMGYSALDGLMMGTRCGSLDPGVVLHLWSRGWSREQVESLLYRRSGLLGVSGLSADLRRLAASAEPRAKAALALFRHRIVREAGALVAVLGGVDLVAFTGGIGEHDADTRAALVQALSPHGVRIDDGLNRGATGERAEALQAPSSRVAVWVVPADEGRVAAREAFACLSPSSTGSRPW